MLRKKPVDGSKLIANAIGKFEAIADEIEAGIAANHAKIASNRQAISTLESECSVLGTDCTHGSNVAAKLRELIA
jgi:hypothetical protein